MKLSWIACVLAVSGCNLLHKSQSGTDAGTATITAETTATTVAAAPAASDDEAGARALLRRFLAPGADRAALTKPLRPNKADYAALFDAPTAAKLQPAYDAHWDKDPMVIEAHEGQTELVLFAATSEDLQSGGGNAGEFPGGWKKVAPHLQPHQTWYRFKFVRPGEHLGMAFDGLTFVNGHWVITPKPWHGL